MSSQKKRIEKVETSLTPKQAVLLWMEEAHSHGSIQAYALWLKEQPESAYPLVRLPRQVREAVRTAMKGQSREAVGWYIDRAERDVIFLFQFVYVLNTRLMEDSRTTAFAFLWLLEKLRPFISWKGTTKDFVNKATEWVGYAKHLLLEVHTTYRAVQEIEKRYFDGRTVLFSDIAEKTEGMAEQWSVLVEMYNDLVQEHAGKTKVKELLLDQEKESRLNEPALRARVAFLVDMAKAEALGLLGEHEKAGTLMEEYVV